MDNHDHYNSHLEPLNAPNICSTQSTVPTNNAENDSENNFDDVSSCASDSAIGVYWINGYFILPVIKCTNTTIFSD